MARSAALLLAACAATGALAQGKPQQQEESFRYLTFSEGEAGDLRIALDGVLQYRREAGAPGKWTLDICFPRRPELTALDRFSAPASVSRGIYTASGPSSVDNLPTSVRIETKTENEVLTLKGEIRVGSQVYTVSDQSSRLQDGIGNEGGSNPLSYGSLMPNELSVKVPIASLRAVLDMVRREKALVLPNQLVAGCGDLREGAQYMRLQAPPAVVPHLAAALKGIADTEVQIADSYTSADGVALPASLNDEPETALVAKFAEAAAKALGTEGAPRITSRPETGEHIVALTRQTETANALGLREEVAITTLIGPDIGGKGGGRALYVTQIGSRFVDPSASPLALSQDLWQATSYTDLLPRRLSLGLINAFAQATGGEARPAGSAR